MLPATQSFLQSAHSVIHTRHSGFYNSPKEVAEKVFSKHPEYKNEELDIKLIFTKIADFLSLKAKREQELYTS